MRIQMAPDFSSWPISPSLKTLLMQDEKWQDYFSVDPAVLASILNSLYAQIKEVDFFASPVDTEQFFEFLRTLVESKPNNDHVLKNFSAITIDILDKISVQTQLNTTHAQVAVHYLNLLSLMLEPNYRYLFNKPEISLWIHDVQKISRIPFNSPELLSQFRNTLLLSFQSNACIRKYPVLLQTIAALALSVEKNHAESNELAAIKLLDTLGVLDHSLKTSRVRRVALNQSAIQHSIQEARDLLYVQFEPFIEENFLQYIVYKSFLSQSYKDSTMNLTQLCESSYYQAQCNADYLRFKDDYNCTPGQFSDFSIDIRNNNLSTVALDKACELMRDAEFFFVSGMKDFGFTPRYNASQYLLHLSASKNDFLIDQLLYERNDPTVRSYTVQATYFPNDARSIPTDFLSGKTYSYNMGAEVLVHEYVHHLYALFVKDLEFDLTTTEGIAEIFSGGVCSVKNIHDLRNFVNDTSIFEFLKHRKYPFYFNALKWVAYLINEQPNLFETLIRLLQEEEKERFYLTIDSFIGNASNLQAFVAWSNQQVNTCNEYLSIFPEAYHQPALVYLESIEQLLDYSKSTVSPQTELISRHVAKRELISSHSKSDFIGTDLVVYSENHKSHLETLQRIAPLPLSALMAGFFSAHLDHIGETSQEKYPSLPAYIHYGFKPFVFALLSAWLDNTLFDSSDEKMARLLTYFVMNFCGTVIGQPLIHIIDEKIPNKILCFLLQSLTWALLWDPSLFMTEYSQLIPMVWMRLLQGLCFKTGDETYKLVKRTYHSSSSFWNNKEERSAFEEPILNNGQLKQMPKISFGQCP